MSKSTTAPTVESPESDKPAHPVGFTITNAARLASDATAVYGMFTRANGLKGNERAKALVHVKSLSACLIADCERSAALANVARGTRIGVNVASTLRGDKTIDKQSVPVLHVLQAIAFGGNVIGSGKLV